MKFTVFPLLGFFIWLAGSVPSVGGSSPVSDAEIEQQVNALLAQMTLQEKIGQMCQRNYWKGVDLRGLVRQGELGSVLNTDNVDTVNALQHAAVEESRLKIPLLIGLDVIHGFRTIFPIPLGQSCSWNLDLMEAGARAAAIEAATQGVRWTFAPMLDLSHDARWGRIAETSGEDPFLSAEIGKAMIRGFQGKDPADPQSLAACAKHYVGYGAVEGGRDYNSTMIPESQLRNIYLPTFKAARDAGALTFMSAFTDLNGVPSSANPFTLRKILREEWGFKGLVVSDWESISELIPQGVASDGKEAAWLAMNAGVDMEMVSTDFRDYAEILLNEKRLSIDVIDESVRRILRVKFKLGLFDHPFTEPTPDFVYLTPEHLQLARDLALQSAVLLKNEGPVLPLSKDLKNIALIGPLADSAADMHGCWFCDAQNADQRTVLSVIKEYLPAETKLVYAPGLEDTLSTTTRGFSAAVQAAEQADIVIMCLGEGHLLSGEARSRAFIDLPGAQESLLRAVAATGKPIVLVIFAGRPLTFSDPALTARAVLYAWHPGTMAGPAICDLLFGRANPSGKLTTTFPRTVGQLPLYYNHMNTGRPAQKEEVGAPMGTPQDPRGYYSKYLDVHSSPAYPFGFGLSYTTFEYTDLTVAEPDEKGIITASATLRNSGTREGTEVAQLYTRQLVGHLTRPVKELKGFRRLVLQPGESQRLVFNLPLQSLGYWNEQGRFEIEAGSYHFWIGGSSEAPLRVPFVLKAEATKRLEASLGPAALKPL